MRRLIGMSMLFFLIVSSIGAQEGETDLQRALNSSKEMDQEDFRKRKGEYFQGLDVKSGSFEDGRVVIEADLKYMQYYNSYFSSSVRAGAMLYRNGEYVGELAADEVEVLSKEEDDGGNSHTYYRVSGRFVDTDPGPEPQSNTYVVAVRFLGQHGNYHEVFATREVSLGKGAATDNAGKSGKKKPQASGGAAELVEQKPADNSSVKKLNKKGEWEEVIPDPTLIIKARYSKDMQTLIITPLVKVTRSDGSVLNYSDFMRDKHIIMDPETGSKLVLGLNGFEFYWFSSYRQGNEIHIPVDDLDPDSSGKLRFHYLYYYTGGPTLGRKIGGTTVVKYPDYAARYKRLEEEKKAADAKRKAEGQTVFKDPEPGPKGLGLDDANKAYDFTKKAYERSKQVYDLIQGVTGEKLYNLGKDVYGDAASLSKSSSGPSDDYRYKAGDSIDKDKYEAKKRGEEAVGGIIDKVKDKVKEKLGFIAEWGSDWVKKKTSDALYTEDEQEVKKIEEMKKELGDNDTLKADLVLELNNFQDERFKKPLQVLESGADKLGFVGKVFKGAKGMYDKASSAVKGLFGDKMKQSYKKVERLIEERYKDGDADWETAVRTAKSNYLEWDGMSFSRHGLTHSGKYGNDPGKYFDSFVSKIKYNKKTEWDRKYGKE